jgi:hypothetical protein
MSSLYLCLRTLKAKKRFALAPNGAIGTKLGEFQEFDNKFFRESSRHN